LKITAYRIFQTRSRADAFSGQGASRFPGRWNQQGVRMVYTAGSLSLAAVEMLVHLDEAKILNLFTYISVTFDCSLCRDLPVAQLPKDWAQYPVPASTREIGTRWIQKQESLVLAVPSAVIAIEKNYLINLLHPDFDKLEIGKPQPFRFDERLVKIIKPKK
jgi:RES domain-containing protein